jgi:hypothetical protein
VTPLVIVAKASTVYECDTCANKCVGTSAVRSATHSPPRSSWVDAARTATNLLLLADMIDLDQMRPYAVELLESATYLTYPFNRVNRTVAWTL